MIIAAALVVRKIQVSSTRGALVGVERVNLLIHESHRVLSSDATLNFVAGTPARSGY